MQLMLMSLPQDNTNWNMVMIVLLQATSNTNKLSTTNVTTHLMQECSCLTSSESTDSALAVHTTKSSKSATTTVKCTYRPCRKPGHTEAECQKKKCNLEKQVSGNFKEKERRKEKKTVANIAKNEVVSKSTLLASIFKSSLPSNDDNDLVHVFIASNVIALLSCESSHDSFIDSGCSYHLSPCHKFFLDETFTILMKPIPVHLGDASTIQATGKGSLRYLMDTPKGTVPAIITNVLYVPELAATLLSVASFTDEDKHHMHSF